MSSYFEDSHSISTGQDPVTPGGVQRIPSTPPRSPPPAPGRLGSPFEYHRDRSPTPSGRGISMSPPPTNDLLQAAIASPTNSRGNHSPLAARVAATATATSYDTSRLRHRIYIQQGLINNLRYDLDQTRGLYRDAIDSKQRLRSTIKELQDYQDKLQGELVCVRQELNDIKVDKAEFEETISWLWLEKNTLRRLTERLLERYGIEDGEEVEFDETSPHPEDYMDNCTWCYVRRSGRVSRERKLSI